MKFQEHQVKSKNLSLAAKDVGDNDGMYQIWSLGSDDEGICHPTHGVMYVKHLVNNSSGKSMFGEFEQQNDLEELKSEEELRDLLISLNVPLNYYNAILSDFDNTCSYLNDMLISMSSEVETNKALL